MESQKRLGVGVVVFALGAVASVPRVPGLAPTPMFGAPMALGLVAWVLVRVMPRLVLRVVLRDAALAMHSVFQWRDAIEFWPPLVEAPAPVDLAAFVGPPRVRYGLSLVALAVVVWVVEEATFCEMAA